MSPTPPILSDNDDDIRNGPHIVSDESTKEHSMSNITKFLLIAPLLAACTQTDVEPAPRAAPIVTLDEAPDLARPQPELPICAHCGADFGLATVLNDDELSMIINSAYVGSIDDLALVIYTNSSKYTLGFDQWVIDDLNNPATSETIVMLDIPDAQRALLVFTLDDETVAYEPVTIES
jgi:hypothetical protein